MALIEDIRRAEKRVQIIREKFAPESRVCDECEGGTELIRRRGKWLWACKAYPTCESYKGVKPELQKKMDDLWDELIQEGK